LRRVHDLVAAGAFSPPAADVRLEMLLPAEDGIPGDLTVRDLQAQSDMFMQFRLTCRQCPSSLSGHVGGCIGSVPYPLSEGLEFLLWTTAVRALKGQLPAELLGPAAAFTQRARQLAKTPFADGMRARGQLLGARSRVYQQGPVWRRVRLSSAQVLDAFFVNGVLAGAELEQHAGFLGAALALARGMANALEDEERRLALEEDTEPYRLVHRLMLTALEQGLGVYVWS
jgi:hypothetical protein